MGKVKSVKLTYPKDDTELQERYAKILVQIIFNTISYENINKLLYETN